MRIIGGEFKGRRLNVPKNITARPTTDFAREGLFNILNSRIEFENCDMLDLFAGTGSIGFEFISRGARSVLAVEQSRRHTDFMRSVSKTLGVDNHIAVRSDVFRYLMSSNKDFDFVFADPPYDLDALPDIPVLVFKHNIIREKGYLVLEHSAKHQFDEHPHFDSRRKYGNVHFSFFRP